MNSVQKNLDCSEGASSDWSTAIFQKTYIRICFLFESRFKTILFGHCFGRSWELKWRFRSSILRRSFSLQCFNMAYYWPWLPQLFVDLQTFPLPYQSQRKLIFVLVSKPRDTWSSNLQWSSNLYHGEKISTYFFHGRSGMGWGSFGYLFLYLLQMLHLCTNCFISCDMFGLKSTGLAIALYFSKRNYDPVKIQ